jgi:hypothetical protein
VIFFTGLQQLDARVVKYTTRGAVSVFGENHARRSIFQSPQTKRVQHGLNKKNLYFATLQTLNDTDYITVRVNLKERE